jgi:hypothetical protein
MQQQAFDLVAAGLTTVEDVVRNVYAPGMEFEVPEVGEVVEPAAAAAVSAAAPVTGPGAVPPAARGGGLVGAPPAPVGDLPAAEVS